uniref:Uncharacterized protein n=1 Tax=Anguilla anguilla TaxID=7936 RepID=A0A0E9TSI3_ANGAN
MNLFTESTIKMDRILNT